MASIKERQALKAGLRHVQTGTRNAIKCSYGTAESTQHRYSKALLCLELYRVGIDFYTECTFNKGGRADIYIPKLELAIEILHTETAVQFLRNKSNYPVRVLAIASDQISEVTANLLADGLRDNPDSTIQEVTYSGLMGWTTIV